MATEQEARRLAEAELRSAEEKLLWAGAPNPAQAAQKAIPAALFGILFTAFAVFWMFMASGLGSGSGAPLPFVLFGIPFVLVGLGILLSPLWAYLSAGKTVYAVTNQRAVIITDGWGGRSVKSYSDEDIRNIERRQKPDGSGDLIFDRERYTTRSRNGGTTSHVREIGFIGVPDVRRVESILYDVFKRQDTPRPPAPPLRMG